MTEVKMIHAHDNEVICLAYSPAISPTTLESLGSGIPFTKERFWLASGSRDKLVHVFDSESNYETVTVLEQH
jgi:WD40 repeat protein